MERIIVSLTTWSKRIQNIPGVLDTIFAQTVRPDKVVLNLAYDEVIPHNVSEYIVSHGVEVNRVPDTKVYKKILPTLKRYRDDVVISIDDDFLYPAGMIADFMEVHKKYPDHPISGNHIIFWGMQCHCGCASLIKSSYLGDYIDLIDGEVMRNCPFDDIVYSYFANKAGFSYVRTKNQYFLNLEAYNQVDGFTESTKESSKDNPAVKTILYLTNKFGPINGPFPSLYVSDKDLAALLYDIHNEIVGRAEQKVCQSLSYRIGNYLVRPIRKIRDILYRR